MTHKTSPRWVLFLNGRSWARQVGNNSGRWLKERGRRPAGDKSAHGRSPTEDPAAFCPVLIGTTIPGPLQRLHHLEHKLKCWLLTKQLVRKQWEYCVLPIILGNHSFSKEVLFLFLLLVLVYNEFSFLPLAKVLWWILFKRSVPPQWTPADS